LRISYETFSFFFFIIISPKEVFRAVPVDHIVQAVVSKRKIKKKIAGVKERYWNKVVKRTSFLVFLGWPGNA